MKTYSPQEVKTALLSNDKGAAQLMLDANETYFTNKIADAQSDADALNAKLDISLHYAAAKSRFAALSDDQKKAERLRRKAENNAFHARLNNVLTSLFDN